MARHLPLAIAVLALLGLGLRVLQQDRSIAALRADLDSVRALAASAAAAQAARASSYRPRERPPPAPPRAAQSTTTPAPAALPAEEPARAVVSRDEIARVESAVLSLLEADRPELREKLRAVVQEQQETLEHQQQDQRRERWIARTEARLSELTGTAALSDAQRETILNILLANRDQIGDLMRSAETSKDYATARDTARRLRTETDTKVRELLKPDQYEAYKHNLEREDERGFQMPPR